MWLERKSDFYFSFMLTTPPFHNTWTHSKGKWVKHFLKQCASMQNGHFWNIHKLKKLKPAIFFSPGLFVTVLVTTFYFFHPKIIFEFFNFRCNCLSSSINLQMFAYFPELSLKLFCKYFNFFIFVWINTEEIKRLCWYYLLVWKFIRLVLHFQTNKQRACYFMHSLKLKNGKKK